MELANLLQRCELEKRIDGTALGCYSHGLLLGALETVGHIVKRLELGDGILGDASYLRLEVLELWLVRQTVLQLAVGGEQAGAKGLQLSLLPTQAVLHGEPEDLKERDRPTTRIRRSELGWHILPWTASQCSRRVRPARPSQSPD